METGLLDYNRAPLKIACGEDLKVCIYKHLEVHVDIGIEVPKCQVQDEGDRKRFLNPRMLYKLIDSGFPVIEIEGMDDKR